MRSCAAVAFCLVLAAVAACRRAPPPAAAPPAPVAVESSTLGLRFAGLPPGIRLADEGADGLSLDAVCDGVPGSLLVRTSPVPASGADLVAEARVFGAAAAAEPGGKFYGGTQLVTPHGIAYTARALVGGGSVEERRVFLVHPGDPYRLVTLVLRYPPSTPEAANAWFRQLLELLAVLEPLPAPAPSALP